MQEKQQEKHEKKAAPPPVTKAEKVEEKKAKRSPVSYAVVYAPNPDGSGDEVKVIEGPMMNDLKTKLADPTLEIIAIFKGRRLEHKAKRQVSFS